MPIRVSLHPNVLAKDGSQFARIVSPARIGLETLLDYMVKDTTLARDDMRSVLEQFREAICYHLKMGHRVATPVGSFHPGVSSGIVRTNGHIPAVSSAHLRVNFVPHGGMVREFRRGAILQTEYFAGFAQTLLMHMSNLDNEIEDVHFPPGTLCKMVGARLSFDKTQPHLGPFFVNVDSPKKEVHISSYSRTGTRYIDFLIPADTPPATYQVELRTLTRGGEPRTSISDRIVHVG